MVIQPHSFLIDVETEQMIAPTDFFTEEVNGSRSEDQQPKLFPEQLRLFQTEQKKNNRRQQQKIGGVLNETVLPVASRSFKHVIHLLKVRVPPENKGRPINEPRRERDSFLHNTFPSNFLIYRLNAVSFSTADAPRTTVPGAP